MNKIKTDKECLNEALTGSPNNDDWHNGQLGAREAIKAIHAYHEQFDRWNDVKTPPTEDKQYNVCYKMNNGMWYVFTTGYSISFKTFDIANVNITNWRELPNPPQK